MLEFHHLGIFVADLHKGLTHLSNLFDVKQVSEITQDENLGVIVQFITDHSGITYELVAPFGSENPVDNVLKSKKNILNHVAYTSDTFDADAEGLRASGAIPLGKAKSAKAFGGCKVLFFLTKLGFIVELIERGTDDRS